MKRDGRSPLTGEISSVKSRILRVYDHSEYCHRVLLKHDNQMYLIKKCEFTEGEINEAMSRDCYFQLMWSNKTRSICDIV